MHLLSEVGLMGPTGDVQRWEGPLRGVSLQGREGSGRQRMEQGQDHPEARAAEARVDAAAQSSPRWTWGSGSSQGL